MKRSINAVLLGSMAGLSGAANASAQFRIRDRFFGDDDNFDVASAGNGGVATASANGGAVSIGNVNSGGNVGNAIAVGDTYGPDPVVYGGDVFNATSLGVSVDGGTAIADASGGSYNIAFVS
jgi:hypothetical protein